jgi:hypothetical protein
MRCEDKSISPIRVGLNQVGVVGLPDALKETDGLDPDDREGAVERMMGQLAPRNYIPDHQAGAYRTALWREFRRHRGLDFSAWYSEVPVTVRGAPGEERDRFQALVTEALASHELRPDFTFEAGGPSPELVIRGEAVARGSQNRASLERAIRRTFSHW